MSNEKAWRCSVCGYIHRAPEPPDFCPVCGSPKEAFEPYFDEKVQARVVQTMRWRCLNCGYIHEGSEPPETCPVCGAPADRFEPLEEGKRSISQGGGKVKVVVAGAGIAGVSVAEALRQVTPDAEILLVSKEDTLPYYRLNLTRFLAGEIGEESLPLHPEEWYREQEIELVLGTEITAIRPEEHEVVLRKNDESSYEKLVLAVGSHPFIPPFPGVHLEGVESLRTFQDAVSILETARNGGKCICIGGGLLGLETAAAVAKQGAEVTLIEGYGWLLPRQLNQRPAEILADHMSNTGIELIMQGRTDEIVGDERVREIRLEDGRSLPADLVIIATGIRSNSYLARSAGLEVNRGVVVNNLVTSSHPDILAAGDVAEYRGTVYGIWGPSQYQGSIAGMNAAGAQAEFGGIPRSNTLKVLGIDLFSIGVVTPEDGSYMTFDHEEDDNYYRFVFQDNYLVGAILLGDTALTASLKKALESKSDFSEILQRRLIGRDLLEIFLQKKYSE